MKLIERFDIDAVYNGEFIELEERIEEDGKYCRFEDVKTLVKQTERKECAAGRCYMDCHIHHDSAIGCLDCGNYENI